MKGFTFFLLRISHVFCPRSVASTSYITLHRWSTPDLGLGLISLYKKLQELKVRADFHTGFPYHTNTGSIVEDRLISSWCIDAHKFCTSRSLSHVLLQTLRLNYRDFLQLAWLFPYEDIAFYLFNQGNSSTLLRGLFNATRPVAPLLCRTGVYFECPEAYSSYRIL